MAHEDDTYQFGAFRLDVPERRLLHGDTPVTLTPKLFDTLALLVREHPHLVLKDTFMHAVWPETFVTDATLAHNISALRKLLGHSGDAPVIETVAKKGYRFVAPVQRPTDSAAIESAVAAAPSAAALGRPGEPLRPDTPAAPTPAADSAAELPAGADHERAVASARATRRLRPALGLAAMLIAVVAIAAYVARLRSGPYAPPDVRSLLVLPLDDMSSEPGHDYLASGITEALTTELARIGSLRVVSRTTAAHYRRQKTPLAQIGRELGVDAVVEGSVARIGNRVRVTAQLIQVNPERHLWAESYDRDAGDAFGLQTDLTEAVMAALHVELSPAGRGRLRRRPVRSDAYEAYLRARYYESGAAGLATERAIATYQRAVELDPSFTAARAGLARAFIFGVGMRPRVALATARETAIEALKLDPAAPEALLASAITRLYYERDFAGADEEFRRAIAADPGNADAHFYYSQCLAAMGRFDEAVDAARRALRLDPLSPLITHYIGRIHYFARQYDKALEMLAEALDIDPHYAFTHIFLASTYERMGDFDRALEHRQTYWTLNQVAADRVAALVSLARTDGYDAALRHWARSAMEYVERVGYLTSTELTHIHAQVGELDEAIRWLERAVDDHTRDLIYLNVEPGFDVLRALPRFADLASQVIG